MKIRFSKKLNLSFGLIVVMTILLSSCKNENVIENYGLITDQVVYDILGNEKDINKNTISHLKKKDLTKAIDYCGFAGIYVKLII